MPGTQHALIDPHRYRAMTSAFKLAHKPYGFARSLVLRTPDWLEEAGYGAGTLLRMELLGSDEGE